MENHWQRLRRRMRQAGLPALGKLPSKNVRRDGNTDLSSHFNADDLIAMALDRYQDDIQLFYGEQDLSQLALGQLSHPPDPIERKGDALGA